MALSARPALSSQVWGKGTGVMPAKNVLIYLLTGVVLGAVAGVLLGWPTAPHMQYLLSDWPYYVASLGTAGGALCGLSLAILSRNQRPSAFEGIVLGAASGMIVQGPIIFPIWRLRGDWLQLLTGGAAGNGWLFFLVSGLVVGVFIHAWDLPGYLDRSLRRSWPLASRTTDPSPLLALARGAVIGGVAGALVTVVMVAVHIVVTTDTVGNTFPRVQTFYAALPICAVVGGGLAGMKLLAGKAVQPGVEVFSPGITAGLLMGMVMEAGILLQSLAAWLEPGFSLASFMGGIASGTVTAVFCAILLAVFAVSVSIAGHVLLNITSVGNAVHGR